MYLCVCGVDFTSFHDFSIGFWKCSDSVVYVVFFISNFKFFHACISSAPPFKLSCFTSA